MKLEWKEKESGKLIINGEVYTIEEACEAFPDNAVEIAKFAKETCIGAYILYKFELANKNNGTNVDGVIVPKPKPEIYETATEAAKWWADRLRGPSLHDAGDEQISMVLNMFSLMNSRPGKDAKKIDEFEKVLERLINEDLKTRGNSYLRVDYHPEGLLLEASLESNFDIDYKLPVKSSMRVTTEEVYISEGYAAPEKQIYPNGNRGRKK